MHEIASEKYLLAAHSSPQCFYACQLALSKYEGFQFENLHLSHRDCLLHAKRTASRGCSSMDFKHKKVEDLPAFRSTKTRRIQATISVQMSIRVNLHTTSKSIDASRKKLQPRQ
ncbi:hypothetical protein F1559_002631 [Cyanidiococcus yangmingshanensis]|uniref:Uncharacterized protein n=1 Tax=Cyanidiococcus yangmingshanensis TaxID=2690220 RepID=A0A7J7IQ24_9RHOD|nr:hypothetical protein F1559_002631 [Cyanidiococcus yangmingshanensis]